MLPPLPIAPCDDPMPPLEQQAEKAGFKAGIMDFQYARHPEISYFNSSLIQTPNGRWLIARRSRVDPQLRVGLNDIVRIELDGVEPKRIIPVRMPWQFMGEHFEDPRAIYHEGTIWISACNFIWGRKSTHWTGAHQVLAKFDSEWNCTGRYDIDYGKNGNDLGHNSGHEKNWAFFMHDGRMHFVYQPDPHTVVGLNDDLTVREEHIANTKPKWDFGQIRGGAPPWRVGDEYWCFFHSSVPVTLNRRLTRRYMMGAYAFSAVPPFPMTRLIDAPLLQGSYKNRWGPDKPAVAFPCGAILVDGEWIVTGGSNDLDTFWARIPHKIIQRRLKPLQPRSWLARFSAESPALS